MCVCVWKLTRTERGDIVCAGEVQCGPRDVHHVVIIVVTGVMKAIEAPVAEARVLPHSEPCEEQRNTGDVNASSTLLGVWKGRTSVLPLLVQKSVIPSGEMWVLSEYPAISHFKSPWRRRAWWIRRSGNNDNTSPITGKFLQLFPPLSVLRSSCSDS